MTINESKDGDDLPIAEELRRQTSRHARDGMSGSTAHDAFLALGESIDASTEDFDWQRMASRLHLEIEAEKSSGLVTIHRRQAGLHPRRAIAWLSCCSAALLLIGLVVGLVSRPVHQQAKSPVAPIPSPNVSGIDSWERTPSQAELINIWNDELDAELAATRRALKQGRDPWVNDEPALSNVFAQVNELSAGLMFEPF